MVSLVSLCVVSWLVRLVLMGHVGLFVRSVVLNRLFVVVVVMTREVFLRFVVSMNTVMTITWIVVRRCSVSWMMQKVFPSGDGGRCCMMRHDSLRRRVLIVVSGVAVTMSMVDWNLFNVVEVVCLVVVMVIEGRSDFLWVGVVVATFNDNVVEIRLSHSEVKRLVLLILVVISIILVSMSVL